MSYSTALSLTLPSLTSDARHQLLEKQPLLSLYEVFATIPDPRSKHGLRYELAYVLTCLVAGFLCNCDSTLAVAEWCRDQRLLLIRLFGPRRFLCPSDSLYRKLLPRLDAEQIECALADWIRRTLQATLDDPIALDGKTVRGGRSDKHSAPHLLSFRAHHSQETLLQVAVSEKTNEIPVAQALLPCLPVDGRVFTADALHTQKDFMRCVDALGGKTVLTVKNNQPTLYADLTAYFADPHASFAQDSTLDQHRGRIEKRSIRVSTEMNSYLADWPLIEQVAELTRTVTVRKTGKTSHEVVYLITPLTALEASPQRLLALVRGHWSIENSSHYVRDMTFGEDRSRLRSGQAPQILATFRNLAITLIHRQGSSQIAATRRHFASHPHLAFRFLLPRSVAQQ
ncbi:ISAs1 family transposase [Ktedonobacter racemifer]|uniref:Transposase IS4 family protein n=1 Tax=Ktedonobacter racemifer DSM 44963 TaxID=485913 RepID=D6TTS2_KTERA|nr:ISAs1 family transposase [Ktedonobacter racemifer]EFH83823.1 transposase IS4 family protein [Ktedonobacter racemifer DSM 44963]